MSRFKQDTVRAPNQQQNPVQLMTVDAMISHVRKNMGIVQRKREKDLEMYEGTMREHEKNFT